MLADLLEARTTIGGEPGYAMKFVERYHSWLTVFDVVSLPGESYPVPQTALDSLPPLARALLEREGMIQFRGSDDADEQVFETVTLEWSDQTPLDRLAELTDADLSVHEATGSEANQQMTDTISCGVSELNSMKGRLSLG